MKAKAAGRAAWALFVMVAMDVAAPATAQTQAWPGTNKGLWPLGVFEKDNPEKPRPKAPCWANARPRTRRRRLRA